MRKTLAIALLKVLRAAEDAPISEQELFDAVCARCRALQPTTTDVQYALIFCAEQQWVQGLSDALRGRSWSLTESGKHCAARL
jgi:hypothetical protein